MMLQMRCSRLGQFPLFRQTFFRRIRLGKPELANIVDCARSRKPLEDVACYF